MNYEELYQTLQGMEKELKDKAATASRLLKAMTRDTETGDLRALSKDIQALAGATAAQSDTLERIRASIDGFDCRSYMESGEYASQMLAFCGERGVDVRGDFPVYEMFPYRVKFDTENQDIYLDRKKIHCMRPASFVNTVKAGQERLTRAPFNAAAFAAELADAYDLAILKTGKNPESDLYLQSLYKFLAPMSRYRKDYDQQSYAFDLARLYANRSLELKDGRRFQFGPSRNSGKSLRILDSEGKEQFLATIRFYQG